MKVLLFTDFSDEEILKIYSNLDKLPKWRMQQAISYHNMIDKVLCIKTYMMLKQGLLEEYSIDEEIEFEYIKNNKPVLKNHPDIYFNLSHCKKGALCVIDSKPIGCDIEEIQNDFTMNLCELCFNQKEINQIYSSSNPYVEFTKLWTIKEAFLKYTGEGLTDDLPSVLESVDERLNIYTKICQDSNCVYTICSNG